MILAECASVGLVLGLYAVLAVAGAAAVLWLALRVVRLEGRLEMLERGACCGASERCRVCGGEVEDGECLRCGVEAE